jgi:hypothetical protein
LAGNLAKRPKARAKYGRIILRVKRCRLNSVGSKYNLVVVFCEKYNEC